MPTTTYLDPAFTASAFQSRTDAAGTDIVDVDGPEVRLPWSAYTEGIVGADSYQVTADGTDMTVDVGSGAAFTDLAVVAGDTASLGKYGLLLEPASTTLTVPAADLSNPRIDEVYLVVVDDPGTMVKARLGYRQGDAASSPSAPGPDASWEGSLLLASISVAAGATTISQGNITDARVVATPVVPAAEVDGSVEVAAVAMTATMADVAAVSLSIPTSWGSWKCEAWASFAFNSSDANPSAISVLIRIDGTDHQELAGIVSNASADRNGGAVGARRTGITTTGSRSVSLRAKEDSGDAVIGDIFLYARAVRTS